MKKTSTIVLEPSTNTHTMTNVVDVVKLEGGILKIKAEKGSMVLHGEHGTLAVESTNVIKYVQQEVNPITKKLQNAWD